MARIREALGFNLNHKYIQNNNKYNSALNPYLLSKCRARRWSGRWAPCRKFLDTLLTARSGLRRCWRWAGPRTTVSWRVQRSPGFPTVLRPWFRTRPLCSWRCDDAGGDGVLEQQRSTPIVSVCTHMHASTHTFIRDALCFLVLSFPHAGIPWTKAWRWLKLLRNSSAGGSEYAKHRFRSPSLFLVSSCISRVHHYWGHQFCLYEVMTGRRGKRIVAKHIAS